MKSIIATIGFTILIITSSFSQRSEESLREDKNTLLAKRPISGGFVSVSGKGGELNDQEDIWIGGEAAAIFGNDLSIGLAGYGLVNTVRSTNLDFNSKTLHYQAGYGGLYVEPAFFENRVINLSFPTVLGAGGIAETRVSGIIDELDEFDISESDLINSDVFWVVEPAVAANLNISRWMKISAAVSYRYAYELSLPNTSSDLLNGVNGTVSLKLGWF